MTSVSSVTADIPEGFEPHVRSSPLSAPWEPIYYKRTADAVILAVRLAEPHTNSRGLAHGGFLTALADNAMGLSCAAKGDSKTRLLTASLSIDFVSSARIGQWVAFETDVIKAGKHLCFAQCFVTADGVRCARVSGTFSAVPKKE
jgi:uncharacterized protein (TIGR00369 family)